MPLTVVQTTFFFKNASMAVNVCKFCKIYRHHQELQMTFFKNVLVTVNICKSSSATMCAMYPSTVSWEEFRGRISNKGGGFEIKHV